MMAASDSLPACLMCMACQVLYVDNGMHAMGWACEQAADYLWTREEPLEESELMGAKYTSQDAASSG